MVSWLINTALERIWKETVVLIEVLSCHLPGETENINYKFCRDSVPTEIQTEYLPITRSLRYRFNNLFDGKDSASFMPARNALFLLLTLSKKHLRLSCPFSRVVVPVLV
jgi:hypothetical protein